MPEHTPHKSRLLPHVVTGVVAVLAVFVVFALLRVGDETTRSAARFLTSADGPALGLSELEGSVGILQAVPGRLDELDTAITGLEAHLDGLAGRVDAVDASLETLGQADAHGVTDRTALATRTGDLESRVDGLLPRLDGIGTDVSDLRDALATAAESGTNAEAVAVRLNTEIERVESIAVRLSNIEEKVTLMENNQPVGSDTVALDEIENIKSSLSKTQSSIEEIQSRSELADLHATWLTFRALRGKAERGETFTSELSALRIGAGLPFDLAALSIHADTPPPPESELLAAFARLPVAEMPPQKVAVSEGVESPPSAPAGFWQSILDQAGSAVSVRRIDETDAAEEAASAPVPPITTLAAGIAQAAPRSGTPAVDGWLTQARARIALDDALTKIAAEFDTRLQAAEAG